MLYRIIYGLVEIFNDWYVAQAGLVAGLVAGLDLKGPDEYLQEILADLGPELVEINNSVHSFFAWRVCRGQYGYREGKLWYAEG